MGDTGFVVSPPNIWLRPRNFNRTIMTITRYYKTTELAELYGLTRNGLFSRLSSLGIVLDRPGVIKIRDFEKLNELVLKEQMEIRDNAEALIARIREYR